MVALERVCTIPGRERRRGPVSRVARSLMREAVDMANILFDGVNSDVNLKNHEIETNR
jgi:hypothetical protein